MMSKISPQLIRDFLATLPSQFQQVNQQLISDLQPKLETWLSSLNLVTKSEFDAQAKILKRAQSDLLVIKSQLAAMNKAPESSEQSEPHDL